MAKPLTELALATTHINIVIQMNVTNTIYTTKSITNRNTIFSRPNHVLQFSSQLQHHTHENLNPLEVTIKIHVHVNSGLH